MARVEERRDRGVIREERNNILSTPTIPVPVSSQKTTNKLDGCEDAKRV